MDLHFLQVFWYFLIAFMLFMYAVLDGFDLGAGALLKVLAKTEKEKRSVLNAIGPFWDGNEVWLLAAGASLFGAFPFSYAVVFSRLYLPMMALIFALIFRAVAVKYWYDDQRFRRLWEWAVVICSIVIPLLLGIALGVVISGVYFIKDWTMGSSGEVTRFYVIFKVFPEACGLLAVALFMAHGAAYIYMRAEGAVKERARTALTVLVVSVILLVCAVFAAGFNRVDYYRFVEERDLWLIWGAVVAVLLACLFQFWAARRRHGRAAFVAGSLSIALLWALLLSVHYPNLFSYEYIGESFVNGLKDSSSALTLKVMTIIALVGLPVVLAATWYMYRVFKGKVTGDEKWGY